MKAETKEYKELVENLKMFDKKTWDDCNQTKIEQYPKEQQDIIYREKNLFYQKWYQEHPDNEESEDQPQDDFTSSEVLSDYDRFIAKTEAQQAEYMAKENPSFVMYHSFYEALEEIHGKDFEAHMRALCERGLYKKNGTYKGSVKMFMAQATPQLEANERKKIAAKLNGLKGGAPCGNTNALKQPKTS
jgi:hypothetical protein